MPEVSFGARRAAVRAVAFDKDGTLLATEPFWRELFRLRYDLVCQAAGAVAARHWQDLMGISEAGEFDRTGPFALGSLEDEALVTAVALYSHTRKPWDQCRQDGMALIVRSNDLLDLGRAVQLLPRAREVVLSLKEAGIAVGVVTSDFVQRAVAGLELAGLPPSTWDFVIGAESVRVHKPAPDMILLASKLTGVAPCDFAVVGDARVDMLMARQAGALAVAVRENGRTASGVTDLADVVIDGVASISL